MERPTVAHGRVRAGKGAGKTTGSHPEAGFLLRSASHKNPTMIKLAVLLRRHEALLACLYFLLFKAARTFLQAY